MAGLIRPPCLAIALATAGQRIRPKIFISSVLSVCSSDQRERARGKQTRFPTEPSRDHPALSGRFMRLIIKKIKDQEAAPRIRVVYILQIYFSSLVSKSGTGAWFRKYVNII